MQKPYFFQKLLTYGLPFWKLYKQSIRLHAAHTAFFLLLSLVPALVLLLEFLQLIRLDALDLEQLLPELVPPVFQGSLQSLIRAVRIHTDRTVLGLSALTSLWSAGRGVHGLMLGLNRIYGTQERRGYIRTRLICAAYILVFFSILMLPLGLQVFSTELLGFLIQTGASWLEFLAGSSLLRLLFLMAVLSLVFTLMYQVLPSERFRFRESLPGGLLTGVGWLIFSGLYSVYVQHFSGLYGSVSLLTLGMLWLYLCICLFFYGGVLNRVLAAGKNGKNMSET